MTGSFWPSRARHEGRPQGIARGDLRWRTVAGLAPGALPHRTSLRWSVRAEQPSIPDDCLRRARDDPAEIRVPRVDENVPFPACHDRGHNKYRRSQLANPAVAKGSGHAQIRMIPTSGQAALVVSLDGERLRDGDLDCHMGARHPSDPGMGQTFQHRARKGTAGVDDTQAR